MSEQGSHRGDETEPIRSTFPPTNPPPPHLPPAGWYPLEGEQRYWDGFVWTEYRAPAAAPAYYGQRYEAPLVITDERTNAATIVIAWIVTVITAGYMFPWAVAATRGKSNTWAVGLVSFFFAWTVIGWVVALVMACLPHRPVIVHYRN